jgi:hypothetical protein
MVKDDVKHQKMKDDSGKSIVYGELPDKELVDMVCAGDSGAEIYLFTDTKYISKIEYHMRRIFKKGETSLDECINEVYLYLKRKDWKKLKQYEGRNGATLATWLSTVERHFLVTKRMRWILELDLLERYRDDMEKETAIKVTLNKMPNLRYRSILIKLYYMNMEPTGLAQEMKVSIDYFYVLHGRAKEQFKKYYRKGD